MKLIPSRDAWKFKRPMQVRALCTVCNGADLKITGLRKDPDGVGFRITCACGNQMTGNVTEASLLHFLIDPAVPSLLDAFISKRRPSGASQENLL